jgi:hypothetical protein
MELRLRENPSIHAALKNPADAYHEASGRQSQYKKPVFPQFSWGSVPNLPIFLGFSPSQRSPSPYFRGF